MSPRIPTTVIPNPVEAPSFPGQLAPGHRLAGRYEVVRLLGAGGMGAVYEGTQVAMQRRVALKLLRPELVADQEARLRFQNEMRATSMVEHPHTLRLYDFGEADGMFFLVMEFVEGRVLSDEIRRGRMAAARVCHIGKAVAHGLSAAHAKGVVHRDLKPDNIMLMDVAGDRDCVKVVDFGIARLLDTPNARLTAQGGVIGTPAYMSPEQANGLQVDHRSDIYSLGLILYEMLTGRPVFAGESLTSLLVAQVTMMPPPVQVHVPDVPLALADLIMRMLAKDRSSRPTSAAEVAEVLAGVEKSLSPSQAPIAMSPSPAPPTSVLVATKTYPAPPSAPPSNVNTFTGHGRWLKPLLVMGAIGTLLLVLALVLAGLGVGSLLHKFGLR